MLAVRPPDILTFPSMAGEVDTGTNSSGSGPLTRTEVYVARGGSWPNAVSGGNDAMAEKQPDEPGGFRDYVKNPEYRKSLEREARRRKRQPNPNELDDSAVRALVFGLLERKPDSRTTDLLRSLGARALPALVEALRDPRFAAADNYGDSILTGSPLEEVCNALEELAPSEAVGPLAELVRHPNPRVRQRAAYTLGYIANDDCVAPIAAALKDPDED